jgi:hypothetical protein
MRRLVFALMAPVLAGAALSAPAVAQQGNAAPAVALSKEQIEQVAFELRVLVSALNSDKVEAPVKEALSQCIYNNSFAKISETMGKVIAENKGKVELRNADQMLFIMVRVCGYDPQKAAAVGAKPATPAPQPARPAGKTPQGR